MRTLAVSLLCALCWHLGQAASRHKHRPRLSGSPGRPNPDPQNSSLESRCKGKPMDLVFVIDSSRSVRPKDYEKVKSFIGDMLAFLGVGEGATRVGLLQYGSYVQREFSLNTHYDQAAMQRAVRDMEHLASGTMTGLALLYTAEEAFSLAQGARPPESNVPRVAVVVTDGRPQDTVEEAAALARQAGIRIFAVGVGRVDMATLRAIGSEPHSDHVYLVANFSQMEKLISVFQSKLCADVDLCKRVDHQCEHICVSTLTSYMCRCRTGYTLQPDGKTCRAQDACATVEHGCQHMCANLPDGYECRCRDGYELDEDGKSCRKIDYCDLGNHGCEHNCISTSDSYICRCKKGYVLNPDAKSCSKIDQCAHGNHGCEHECLNTEDSFVCRCRKGYTLRPDSKTCKKILQCSLPHHGCEHECVNTDDSFVCRCRKGYILRPDGKTCKSMDVCQTVDHGCEHLCVSTASSYMCKCFEGYTLAEDGKSCRKPECRSSVMDLVFVIDGSKSLGTANFELVKQFVNSMVKSLSVSPEGTRVGLVQYSTKVQPEFTLARHTSAQEVQSAVTAVRYMGRGSMTGSALRHMFEHSFSAEEGGRAGVPRVSIVFTDGRSQDDVSKWAKLAQEAGITIYAIGVGKAIEEELREIASEPDDTHLYYTEDFSRIDEITQKIKSHMHLCEGKPSFEDPCMCESVLSFQRDSTEQMKKLVQKLEDATLRIEMLENELRLK